MSSRPEEKQHELAGGEQVARAVEDARDAAREITHSRTERARVLGEGERHSRHDGAHPEQRLQQGADGRTASVGGDTGTGPAELGECRDSSAEMVEKRERAAAHRSAGGAE